MRALAVCALLLSCSQSATLELSPSSVQQSESTQTVFILTGYEPQQVLERSRSEIRVVSDLEVQVGPRVGTLISVNADGLSFSLGEQLDVGSHSVQLSARSETSATREPLLVYESQSGGSGGSVTEGSAGSWSGGFGGTASGGFGGATTGGSGGATGGTSGASGGTGGAATGGTGGTSGVATGGTSGTGGAATGGTGGGSANSCVNPPIPVSCNALNGFGCAAGETCDIIASSGPGGFEVKCFGPPASALPGAACDKQKGPYCVTGYHCRTLTKRCVKLCCKGTDCGNSGKCTLLGSSIGALGLCL